LATLDLRMYARRGAEARLLELKEEMAAIHTAFPELRDRRPERARRARSRTPVDQEQSLALGATGVSVTRAPKRRKMTAAQRKAVGERMRKYWAQRRKQT
jgi:hypothetical protein